MALDIIHLHGLVKIFVVIHEIYITVFSVDISLLFNIMLV